MVGAAQLSSTWVGADEPADPIEEWPAGRRIDIAKPDGSRPPLVAEAAQTIAEATRVTPHRIPSKYPCPCSRA